MTIIPPIVLIVWNKRPMLTQPLRTADAEPAARREMLPAGRPIADGCRLHDLRFLACFVVPDVSNENRDHFPLLTD